MFPISTTRGQWWLHRCLVFLEALRVWEQSWWVTTCWSQPSWSGSWLAWGTGAPIPGDTRAAFHYCSWGSLTKEVHQSKNWIDLHFFRHLFSEVTVMDVLFSIARREWIFHYLSVIKRKQSQGDMNIRKMNVWYWGVLCLFVLVLSLYHSAGQWRCFKYDCKPVDPTTG